MINMIINDDNHRSRKLISFCLADHFLSEIHAQGSLSCIFSNERAEETQGLVLTSAGLLNGLILRPDKFKPSTLFLPF